MRRRHAGRQAMQGSRPAHFFFRPRDHIGTAAGNNEDGAQRAAEGAGVLRHREGRCARSSGALSAQRGRYRRQPPAAASLAIRMTRSRIRLPRYHAPTALTRCGDGYGCAGGLDHGHKAAAEDFSGRQVKEAGRLGGGRGGQTNRACNQRTASPGPWPAAGQKKAATGRVPGSGPT